jgi:hypothetical protein
MKMRILAALLFTAAMLSPAEGGHPSGHSGTLFGYRYGFGGGMGLSAVSVNDVVSYLNLLYVNQPQDRLSEFSTAVEFFGTFDYFLSESYSGGVEYAYLLFSHNLSTGFGTNDFTVSYHLPLVLVHYLVAGSNYFFKFGGGMGYLFVRYKEDLVDLPDAIVYTGGGLGGKLQAVGHTPFGDNLYAYIGVDMRFGFPGSVENADGQTLRSREGDVSFNFFSFGLKFGLTYFFN